MYNAVLRMTVCPDLARKVATTTMGAANTSATPGSLKFVFYDIKHRQKDKIQNQ